MEHNRQYEGILYNTSGHMGNETKLSPKNAATPFVVQCIRMLYYVLFLVTPLLMTTQTSEMFELPKILFMYSIVSTIVIVWGWSVLTRAIQLTIRREYVVLGVFVLVQMIATILSVDLHTSIFGYYGRFNGGLLSTVMFAIVFFVASQILDIGSFRKLLIISAVSSLLVLVWGIPGRLFGVDLSCILFRGDFSTSCWTNEFRPQERMFSTIGQPNWLGVYLMIHVFIGVFLLWTSASLNSSLHLLLKKGIGAEKMNRFTREQYLLMFYIAMMSLGVYFTGSRSSELGLVIGSITAFFILIHRYTKPYLFRISLGLVIIGGLIIGLWYGYKLWSSRTDKITHSGTIRLIVWEGALKLAARYPIFGSGPETFAYTYFLTRPEAHNLTTERDFIYNKVHNEFLHFLVTSGIAGFATYTYLLYCFARSVKGKQGGMVIYSCIIAICVANFFGFSTTTSQLMLYILPVYGLLSVSPQMGHLRTTSESRARWSVGLKGVSVLLALFLWIITQKYVIDYYRADLAYAQALQDQSAGDSIQSVESFTKALSLRFEHIYADKFALVSAHTAYVLSQVDGKDAYVDQVAGFVRIAERMQSIAVRSSPSNPMYWKDRVRMYKVVSEVVKGSEKVRVQSQISTAISNAALLSPTDLEIRDWMNGK